VTRYVCIHCHFYQPPRENPWLEEIELQDSAHPYHDWNVRVTFECYAPNMAARILGPDRKIIDIVSNYKKISHDIGPTLLSWMEAKEPEMLRAIVEAGRGSADRFSGHAPALAQAYNHIILPLSNDRDRRTQVIWGIREFEHRLGKKPEGMWLPETAVDRNCLDILSEQGMKFVILAPHQIARYRKIGEEEWIDAAGVLDVRQPYQFRLESGRTIAIFVYDGQIAKDVAFSDLLENGEAFASRLVSAFSGDEDQLVNIATDGETYGHHRPGGDMALAYCLYHLQARDLARITVYGEYLESHPPTLEAEINENTSWSCPHGIERWKSDCGCNTGSHPDWNQSWRAPLRSAMDWVRDALIPVYEKEAVLYFGDPWKTRDDYIEVVLDRSQENISRFMAGHALKKFSGLELVKALKLLEMQRHAMLMYTSDGWFFDEISGIETTQILKYASRAMQLAREVSGIDLEPEYIKRLSQARSNIREFEHGEKIYELLVKPSALDLQRVAAHYAISSLFSEYPEKAKVFCYTVQKEAYNLERAGEEKLAVGKINVRSEVTMEEETFSFAVLHFGGHNLTGGAQRFGGDEQYSAMQKEIEESFARRDIPEVIRLMVKHFGTNNYTIWHLFRDEQRKILDQILEKDLKEIDATFRQAYERHYPFMQVIRDLRVPLPGSMQSIVNSVIDKDLSGMLREEKLDMEAFKELQEEIKRLSPQIEKKSLSYIVSSRIDDLMVQLDKAPEDPVPMETIVDLLYIADELQLNPNLWKAQNLLFSLSKKIREGMKARADQGDGFAKRWTDLLKSMEDRMQVRIS
jgi:alpha-amylase/alpha-mannosidase (GH57 family)